MVGSARVVIVIVPGESITTAIQRWDADYGAVMLSDALAPSRPRVDLGALCETLTLIMVGENRERRLWQKVTFRWYLRTRARAPRSRPPSSPPRCNAKASRWRAVALRC